MGWEFDESEVQVGIAPEGEHLAYLIRVQLGHSTKGEEKAELEFHSAMGHLICYDTVMLQGRGLGIGLKKLQQLGVARKDEDRGKWIVDDVEAWTGRTVYLTIIHEEYGGRTRAKVSFDAEGFGYRMGDDGPEDDAPAVPLADDEDIPF